MLKDEIFKRTSYYTCYRFGNRKTTVGRGCFGSLFYEGRLDKLQTSTYHVYAFIGFGSEYSNNCFMTKEEVEEHLGYLNEIVPMEYYKVREIKFAYCGDKEKKIPAFDIAIRLKNQRRIKHKYALTWIRYIYEYPYNLILMDARRLKKGQLKDETMINLFTLVVRCFKSCKFMYGSGHSMPTTLSGFVSDIDVINHLDRSTDLNSIFPRTGVSIPQIPGGSETKYLEYWAVDDYFNKRAKVYMEAYNILKRK